MASSSSSLADPIPIPIPKPISQFLNSATTHLLSLLPHPKTTPFASSSSSSKICVPFAYPESQFLQISPSRLESAMKGPSSAAFPSTVRVSGLSSGGKGGGGGGPAFVGQVFSICDLSGTGLMAGGSTHFDVIAKRTPEWLKKMFVSITKNERKNEQVFRFFMDLGDAVTYVKRLKIPSGIVGACRLDVAYEHFKREPHLFEFVPNEKQVKAANKLLKEVPQNDGRRSIEGVPVFGAQNLDIAIATTDGIKWYTPYFFDKGMLDNILEESVDQHFHTLIQTRHIQRRRHVPDEGVPSEGIESIADSLSEPPEVGEMMDQLVREIAKEAGPKMAKELGQELADEMGQGIMSVVSKVAEVELLYAVDRVLLGNRWLRKATGIQPQFPYMVDSFEKRTAASFLRASESTSYISNTETEVSKDHQNHGALELEPKDGAQADKGQKPDFRFPFGDWFSNPFLKQQHKLQNSVDDPSRESVKQESQLNPLLPKVTMVGISTGEAGQMSKSSVTNTMNKLTKELEEIERGNAVGTRSSELKSEDRDPLFVANVGDYYSRTSSSRWVRRGRARQQPR